MHIHVLLMIYCEFVQLVKSKTLCVILDQSEFIKYINFWNYGSRVMDNIDYISHGRVKSGSIVITSLYNTCHKSVYFWHSIKCISFSTQSTVHCLQSLSIGGGTGCLYLPLSILS